MGIALVALMTMVMFGFNVGQLYFAQRDLERQAGLAALSAVQVASGCRAGLGVVPGTLGVPGNLAAITVAVNDSLTKNYSSQSPVLPTATIELGTIDANTGLKKFHTLPAGSALIDTVRVRLQRPQPALIAAGLFGANSGAMLSATATARQPNVASFTVGTSLLTVDSTKSALLNALLSGVGGGAINLSAVAYNGILAGQVTLGHLMVAAGVNDLNDLLTVSTTLPGALQIVGNALSMSADVASQTAGSLVSTLGGQSYTTPGTVNFGEILGSAVGTTLNPVATDVIAAVPFVNGLQLLNALALDAASHKASGSQINLSPVLSIPGIAGLGAFLHVIEPPVLAIGPVGTQAKSSQLQLDLRLSLFDSSSVAPGILSGALGLLSSLLSGVINVTLGADVTVADGSATLSNLQCPTAATTNPSARFGMTADAATVKLGAFQGSVATDPPLKAGSLLTIGGGLILNASVGSPVFTQVGTAINANSGAFTSYNAPLSTSPPNAAGLEYTPTANTGTFTTGSNNLLSSAVPSLLTSLVQSLNLNVLVLVPASALLAPVVNILNALIITPLTTLLDSLINPLLQLLGVQIGSATLNLNYVTIGSPVVESFCSPTNPIPGQATCDQ